MPVIPHPSQISILFALTRPYVLFPNILEMGPRFRGDDGRWVCGGDGGVRRFFGLCCGGLVVRWRVLGSVR